MEEKSDIQLGHEQMQKAAASRSEISKIQMTTFGAVVVLDIVLLREYEGDWCWITYFAAAALPFLGFSAAVAYISFVTLKNIETLSAGWHLLGRKVDLASGSYRQEIDRNLRILKGVPKYTFWTPQIGLLLFASAIILILVRHVFW